MDKMILNTILLYSINVNEQSIDIDKLKQLSADDWSEVVAHLKYRRVAPLFYYRLRKDNLDSYVPDEFMKKLQEIHRDTVDDNVRMYFKISKVFSKLIDEEIPFIVQKGAALAELIYPSIGLRYMSDVDMLVKKEDKTRIEKAMTDLGWKIVPDTSLSDDDLHDPMAIIYNNELNQIEFHLNIHEIPAFDPWINASVEKIASHDVLIMGKGDFLIHLCVHLYEHFYIKYDGCSNLIWWYDILEFTRHYGHEIDWNDMIKVVREYKIEKLMYRILYLIKYELGGDTPSEFLNQIKTKIPPTSINDILNPPQKPIADFYTLISSLSINGKYSTYKRLYHVYRSIIPSREFIIFKYSLKRRNSVYLYYFVRIFTGIGKIVKGLFHLPVYLKPKN